MGTLAAHNALTATLDSLATFAAPTTNPRAVSASSAGILESRTHSAATTVFG
jgi:hypothetical protein